MIYIITAINLEGEIITLKTESSSYNEAHLVATRQNLTVLDIRHGSWLNQNLNFKLGRKKFPLVLFNQELIALLDAGLSITEALDALHSKEKDSFIKSTIFSVLTSLKNGLNLSTALSRESNTFPALFLATIKASEKTGNLVESLKRYVSYQLQIETIRKKLISASIYPAVLMGVGFMVIFFLMMYVVPKFSKIYLDTGREMPWASELLVYIGGLLDQNGGLIALCLIALFMVLHRISMRSETKKNFQILLWKMPFIGEKARIYQLTRFYRTMGMLTSAGIPIASALDQVTDLLNEQLKEKLKEAKKLIREGLSLSLAFEKTNLSTPIADRLLRVGERTGQMGKMLDKIASFHEEELSRWVDLTAKLLEPLLMTFMGVLIGGIVVLMYMPIFELVGSIE